MGSSSSARHGLTITSRPRKEPALPPSTSQLTGSFTRQPARPAVSARAGRRQSIVSRTLSSRLSSRHRIVRPAPVAGSVPARPRRGARSRSAHKLNMKHCLLDANASKPRNMSRSMLVALVSREPSPKVFAPAICVTRAILAYSRPTYNIL